jgi:hypothetical protein
MQIFVVGLVLFVIAMTLSVLVSRRTDRIREIDPETANKLEWLRFLTFYRR